MTLSVNMAIKIIHVRINRWQTLPELRIDCPKMSQLNTRYWNETDTCSHEQRLVIALFSIDYEDILAVYK